MRFLWALLAVAPAFGQYPAPAPVFSRIFGGASGSDAATGLAVDGAGNVAVIGTTDSPDFPVTAGAYQPRLTNYPLIAITATGATYPPIAAAGITALAASNDGSAVYAASATGLYRSSDRGATWTQSSSSFISAISLAVDAGSPDTVYGGIPFAVGPYVAGGNYKSTDGGVTWSRIGSFRAGPLFASSTVPGLIYLSIGGIYRSADGGVTWTQNVSPHGISVLAMALAPSDSGVVYTVGSDGLLYRGADQGNSWTAPGGSFGNVFGNPSFALAVDPGNADTVWAVNGVGAVSKSTDGGATFTGVFSGGANVRFLSIDPTGENIVAGGMASFDAGSTWQSAPNITATAAIATPGSILFGETNVSQQFLTKWTADGARMIFSTFLPGSYGVTRGVIASDAVGDTWVATNSLMKFDPSGNLLTSQSLGNLLFSAMTLDSTGNVYVLGTLGTCFTQVMKFSPQGALIYSQPVSQLCDSNSVAIAADSSGAVYIAGSTQSTSLATTPTAIQPAPPPAPPGTPPGQGQPAEIEAGFLAVLNPDGAQLSYLSYLGSSYSQVNGIALDAARNVYVTGASADVPFPFAVTSNLRAASGCEAIGNPFPGYPTLAFAFAVKLTTSSPTPAWLTEIGGGCDTETRATQIAVDPSGNVWLGGYTNSGIFPVISPVELTGYHTAFVSELTPGGNQSSFSSYAPGQFALDPAGTLYLAGAALPNPPKIGVAVFGTAGATSAIVERFQPGVSQPAVIESIGGPLGGAPMDTLTQFLTIAPGELLRITGHGLGPQSLVAGQLQGGRVANDIAGTRVLFNGIPAPLISAQDELIECLVPFEIGDLSNVSVQIERNGAAASTGVVVGLTPQAFIAPVLAVANGDGAFNSQSNPAHSGELVVLYVTGFGGTIPAQSDGAVTTVPLPAAPYPFTSVGAQLYYAGPAPGLAAGIWQVNLVPQRQPANSQNPVTVYIQSTLSIDGDNPSASAQVWLAP